MFKYVQVCCAVYSAFREVHFAVGYCTKHIQMYITLNMCPELCSELAFYNIQPDLLQGLLEFIMIQTNQYFSSILKQLFDLSDRIYNGA